MAEYKYLITYPPGTNDLAESEVTEAGGQNFERTYSRLSFTGDVSVGYYLCLRSRIINRVLIELACVDASSQENYYRAVKAIPWETHINEGSTLGILASGVNTVFRHTRYTSQYTKDAIVDRLREQTGRRPDIEYPKPVFSLYVLMERDKAHICLDISGEPLFKRGYRIDRGEAPLKENVAAAVLKRARWPEDYPGGVLIDPMCGSGTLAIEAALMSMNIAPGLLRDYFGFFGWSAHDGDLWTEMKKSASSEKTGGGVTIIASDRDKRILAAARENIEAAGLASAIQIQNRDFFSPPALGRVPERAKGLLVMNPPYGIRIHGDRRVSPEDFYRKIGDTLRDLYPGWNASVLASPPELAEAIGIPASRKNALKNGALDCSLVHLEIFSNAKREALETRHSQMSVEDLDDGSRMLYNRLKKNKKALKHYLSKEGISSFRLYDKDLPEYGVAIDVYEDTWFHIQEYAPPKTVDEGKARKRLADVTKVVQVLFQTKPSNVFVKTRSKMKGSAQYTANSSGGEKLIMREGGHRFYVNFTDYLDTGIFLDHRIVRKLVEQTCRDTGAQGSFLNLFCYTATASVYAASAGFSTVSVDASGTYLDWAKDNFRLNSLNPDAHRFIQEGCFEWLGESTETFDCILLDPPTFSNTKSSRRNFDVQKDHTELLQLTIRRLKPGGKLIFSTNFRKFSPDFSQLENITVKEISETTIPEDFRKKIHRSFELKKY